MVKQSTTSQDASTKAFVKVGECLWRSTASKRYYVFLSRRGKQYHRSLKTTNRALAERRLSAFRRRVSNLSPTKEASNMTFAVLAARWLETVRGGMKPASVDRRRTSIGQLQPFFAGMLVRNITPRDVDEWQIRRGKTISASSYNNERDTLRRILDYAKRDGVIMDSPADHLPRRKLTKSAMLIPTMEQFRLLVDTIRQSDDRAEAGADLVELLAYSGMRLREATSLLWGDVDMQRSTFTVTGGETGTKNSETRTVPLFPAMRQLLERIRADKSPKPSERVIPIESAKRAMATACRNAELPHFHHHTLRHYFVSNAIEAGIDFKVIAGWVGHKDGGVLVARTYGHLRDAHSFEMAKRMTFSALDEAPENVVQIKQAEGQG